MKAAVAETFDEIVFKNKADLISLLSKTGQGGDATR